MGVSNMRHIWHAMSHDDVFTDVLWDQRFCGTFDHRLASFRPHAVDYVPWQVVTNTTRITHKTAASCLARKSAGSGADVIDWVVENAAAPYDVVAFFSGPWDASFVGHNLVMDERIGYEAQIDTAVRKLQQAWHSTRVVLFTPTPCSPTVVWNGSALTKPKGATPTAGCKMVAKFRNITFRIASRHRHVRVLDAHQMATSHPGGQVGGYPGIWGKQANEWHFSHISSRRERDEARRKSPQSAAGELNRAVANRLINEICLPTRVNSEPNLKEQNEKLARDNKLLKEQLTIALRMNTALVNLSSLRS